MYAVVKFCKVSGSVTMLRFANVIGSYAFACFFVCVFEFVLIF